MPTPIDDIVNPKPDNYEKEVIAVLYAAKHQPTPQALTKQEILNACRFDWFTVAKPGEGGVLLSLAMAWAGHETGLRAQLDEMRAAALEKLVERGAVVGHKHEDKMHYWLSDDFQPDPALVQRQLT